MNALLSIGSKFSAGFLDRVSTWRHSFSQPIGHSTMLHPRCGPQSSATGRPGLPSFPVKVITRMRRVPWGFRRPRTLIFLSTAKATDHATWPPAPSSNDTSAPSGSSTSTSRLSEPQVNKERATVGVAAQIRFCGRTPAGAVQPVVRRLGRVLFWYRGNRSL